MSLSRGRLEVQQSTENRFDARACWVCLGLALVAMVAGVLFWTSDYISAAYGCLGGALVASMFANAFNMLARTERGMGQRPPFARW